MRLNTALGYEVTDYELQEAVFVDFMQNAAEQYQMTPEEKKAQEASKKKTKRKRYLAIGLAAVGGGALIGLTGGLAAPFVAGIMLSTSFQRGVSTSHAPFDETPGAPCLPL